MATAEIEERERYRYLQLKMKMAQHQNSQPADESSPDGLDQGTSPEDLLKSAAPSNVLKQVGVATQNAPGLVGTVINSLPGIGNPSQIMPAAQNLVNDPNQIPEAFKRASQVQSGAPLTPSETPPALAGQAAGVGMEVAGMPSLSTSGTEATGPVSAGFKDPSTALPGTFDEAGKALGEAKSAAKVGEDLNEASALRVALRKDPVSLAEEAIKATTQGTNASLWSQSTSRLLAWREALGKMQADGGGTADDYAKASKFISSVLESREPELMDAMGKMRLNFIAQGNKAVKFPWFTAALNPKVGLLKAVLTIPGVQNTIGAAAGKAAQKIGSIASFANQYNPFKNNPQGPTSQDIEQNIYNALKSDNPGKLVQIKELAETNNINFPKALKNAQKGLKQEKQGKSGFKMGQMVPDDTWNQMRKMTQ